MKKTKPKIIREIASKLDFPSDIYFGGFRIEMYSECEAVIWGVKGIADYTYEKVELSHRRGKIIFEGAGLSCSSYVEGVVCITGEILAIRFAGRG